MALTGVMGALAQEVLDAIVGNASLSQTMGITRDDAANGFLALTQVYLAIIAYGYTVQALGKLGGEEADGRLEPVLSGAVLKAGLAYLPAELVIAGVAVAVTDCSRAFALAWVAFAAVTFIGLLGSGLATAPVGARPSPLPTTAIHPKATSTPPTSPGCCWRHSC